MLAVCREQEVNLFPVTLAPSPTQSHRDNPHYFFLVSHLPPLSSDHLSDLQGRAEGDPRASWDFYSSSVLGKFWVGRLAICMYRYHQYFLEVGAPTVEAAIPHLVVVYKPFQPFPLRLQSLVWSLRCHTDLHKIFLPCLLPLYHPGRFVNPSVNLFLVLLTL